jgi:hypothetical protein
VGYSNEAKSIIPEDASRIFEIFGEGKGTLDHQSRKNYFVDILSTHQYGKICLEVVFLSFTLFGR